jgi:hypothetical protein
MAKPIPGNIEYAYNRMYVVVNPNALLGPPTYRISIPEDLSGSGGGGGTGVAYDFDGVAPINVNTTPGVGNNPTIVETSMDIQQLNDRTI